MDTHEADGSTGFSETRSIDDLTVLYLSGRDTPCPSCAYNRRDATSGSCPECGHILRLAPVSVINKDARCVLRWLAISILVVSSTQIVMYLTFWFHVFQITGYFDTSFMIIQGFETLMWFVVFGLSIGALIASRGERETRIRIGLLPIFIIAGLSLIEMFTWLWRML